MRATPDCQPDEPAAASGTRIPELIGQAPAFLKAVSLIERMAACGASVLLRGETGTGKELAARAIHYLGARRNMPFIPINCGALPDMLIESELFGHVRGAFTDARDTQIGLVAQADGGTLFLDEVDSLSPKAQIALLRFLEDGSYRPVGGKTTTTSRARVIAATNADLASRMQRGAFREDLFFRLSIVPLQLPALRDRPGDAALLAENFLRVLAQQHGRGPRRIDPESLRLLELHHWPGNVRELGNVIHREFLLAEGDCLRIAQESLGGTGGVGREGIGSEGCLKDSSFHRARAEALAAFERLFVRRALTESEGNVSLAAKRAGKERRSFGRLLKKHGIDKNDYLRV